MPEEKTLKELTDEELDKKITTLQRIIFSNNINLSQQARPIYAQYINEQNKRLDEKLSKHLKNNNTEENTIINIG